MKGMETTPIQLLLSLIIIAVVVGFGWSQITGFLAFKSEKDFKEGMLTIYQQMYNLKVLSDQGGFGSALITVPHGYKIVVDVNNDVLIGQKENGEEVYRIQTKGVDITNVKGTDGSNYFGPSNYDIRLVYTNSPTCDLSFAICFK
jgi:hypothetical protein